MVSKEEMAKAEGELKVADAQLQEAMENRRSPRPSSTWPSRFSRSTRSSLRSTESSSSVMKNPGESVRANEAVVQLGKLSRACANVYVPLKHAFKVREGQIVEIRPKVDSLGRRQGGDREPEIPGQDHLR